MPPAGREPLAAEVGGEYVVHAPGRPPLRFQSPLSTARIKSLFAALGPDWLARYLDAYLLDKKIPELYQALGAHKKDLAAWIGQVSLRTLERAQKLVRQRLWDQFGDAQPAASPARYRPLDLSHVIQAAGPAAKAIRIETGLDLLAHYDQSLTERLSGQAPWPFIRPELEVEDARGPRSPASPEDVGLAQGVTLLAGLPGSGKTTLQAWVAKQRRTEGRGLDIFVNLDQYARSGLASIYEFAADRLRQDFDLPTKLDELRSALVERDRQGDILWHVDNWDRLHPDERGRAFSSLAGLTHALVATADPQGFSSQAQGRSLRFPRKIYHLLPWTPAQQAEYLAIFAQSRTGFEHMAAAELARGLPGLARLPAGMAYMLKNISPSLTQTLLGFLDSRQQARGHAPVRLHCRRDRQGDAVDWSNPAVNQVFAGVAAMMQAGLSARYEPEQLAQIDRVILGACLSDPQESLENRMKRADTLLEAGVRAGLLTRVGARFL
jgi:hypothetical protein